VFSEHPECRRPSPNCTKVLEHTYIHDLESMPVLGFPLELAFERAVVLNIRDSRHSGSRMSWRERASTFEPDIHGCNPDTQAPRSTARYMNGNLSSIQSVLCLHQFVWIKFLGVKMASTRHPVKSGKLRLPLVTFTIHDGKCVH
jgi:hypothetical protein